MAFNLIDSVNNLFSTDLISKAASTFEEHEGGIQKALSVAIPSVLTGFLSKSGSSNGPQSLLHLAKQASSSGLVNDLGGLLDEGGGRFSGLLGMAGNLFADKLSNVSNLIADYAGIKTSSASSLLNIAAPAALGSLGKFAAESNLGISELPSFMVAQKSAILSAIPSEFNLAAALGLESLSGIEPKAGSSASVVTGNGEHWVTTEQTSAKKANWMLPLILAVLAFVLLLLLFRSCGSHTETTTAADANTVTPPVVETPAAAAVEPVREFVKVKLSDNTELDAYKGGIEDMLVSYLISNEAISKDKWFDFDDLNFETGSATISEASLKQVQNIAAILKAFPGVQIKIGGYTDNTGDSATNVKLSQARADAVLAKLKALETDAKQLAGAEGYGPTHFVAPNDTEKNKQKNRRISINVKEK